MPREIVTDWTTASGGGKASVMFFDRLGDVAQQRLALRSFWQSMDNLLTPANTWSIRTDGRDLDDETGILVEAWDDGTPYTGTGAVTGEPVADSTQILIRWATSTIFGGRFVKGRTFVPGCVVGNLDDGNLSSAAVTVANSAANQLLLDTSDFGVWSRPQPDRAGLFATATGASCWNELAVLRRRRN